MIRRGPAPKRDFTIINNSILRDRNLSYRARGMLMLMLSYPEDWRFTREWLAEQSEHDGVSAVRTILRELEQRGYLVRRRYKDKTGRFVWEQILFDEPQATEGEQTKAQVSSTGGLPADGPASVGSPSDGGQPIYEELRRRTVDEDDMTCPPRSQASDGGEPSREDPEFENRALWRQLLGGDLTITEGKWSDTNPVGTVATADTVYSAFLEHRGLTRPGRWLETVIENGEFEEWLLREGFELVPAKHDGDTTPRCRCGVRLVLLASQKARECARCRVSSSNGHAVSGAVAA